MSTVEKALSLLQELSTFPDDAGLTDIAERCCLDRATARRFLADFEKFGFVERVSASRKYRLGPATVRLARIREFRFPFLRIAAPLAEQLADMVGECVHISILGGQALSVVHVLDSKWSHRVVVEVGDDLPLHATASGIAVLSLSNGSVVDGVLSGGLDAYTGYTITRSEQLLQSIEDARRNGFSLSLQGLDNGVASVAAPIGMRDEPFGAVSIAVPLDRWKPPDARRLGSMVAATAMAITGSLLGMSGGGL